MLEQIRKVQVPCITQRVSCLSSIKSDVFEKQYRKSCRILQFLNHFGYLNFLYPVIMFIISRFVLHKKKDRCYI